MAISIVLSDDHPLVRCGLRTVLETQPNFAIIGECGDGLNTVRLVKRLKPNVLVLDLMLPGLSGLEILRIIPQRSPATATVVLSMHSTNAFIAEALKNGALGYVLKGSSEDNIIRAVSEAAAGRRYLSPPLNQEDIDAYVAQLKAGPFDPHETLTPREREVLQLAAEGQTCPEIAGRLHISQRTAENHRANLMRKLGLQNQTDLVCHALQHGLIAIEN